MASRSKLTLAVWIEQIGVIEVSRLMRTHRSNVCNWRAGRQLPRAKQMNKITFFTKGALTPNDIIGDFFGPYKLRKVELEILKRK